MQKKDFTTYTYNPYPDDDPRSINYKRKLNRPEIHYYKAVLAALPVCALAFLCFVMPVWGVRIPYAGWIFALLTIVYLIIISKKACIFLIHIYQRYAPDHIRERCRFEPSCSEYMIMSIQKHGTILGIINGIGRLRRCNKDDGGYDYL